MQFAVRNGLFAEKGGLWVMCAFVLVFGFSFVWGAFADEVEVLLPCRSPGWGKSGKLSRISGGEFWGVFGFFEVRQQLLVLEDTLPRVEGRHHDPVPHVLGLGAELSSPRHADVSRGVPLPRVDVRFQLPSQS